MAPVNQSLTEGLPWVRKIKEKLEKEAERVVREMNEFPYF